MMLLKKFNKLLNGICTYFGRESLDHSRLPNQWKVAHTDGLYNNRCLPIKCGLNCARAVRQKRFWCFQTNIAGNS